METLRANISDTINELNKLLLESISEEEESKIRKLRRIYFALWEEVIKKEIDNSSFEFKEAIDALKIAHKKALDAQADIKKVAEAINKAVSAARAVDAVVKLGIDLLS